MRTVAIVQARMGSTRFPGKVMADLGGRPLLAQQIIRLRRCRHVDEIVIATTHKSEDDVIVDLANVEGTRWWRGDELNVLKRYKDAAAASSADVVVRITADCPLIDPEVTDRVIDTLTSDRRGLDYASNVVRRTFPRGLDTEAFFRDVLDRISRLALSGSAREHVTSLILAERQELFVVGSVEDDDDNSDLRWTVDTRADLELVRRIYEGMKLGEHIPSYSTILSYVRSTPALLQLNSHIVQKPQ